MNKRVSVFGAQSKSAQHLINELEKEGYSVKSFSSKTSAGISTVYNLYQNEEISFDCDYAVYFSWSTIRNRKNQEISADAAIRFGKAALDQKVKVIFISSLAALPTRNRSCYGETKHRAEQSMKQMGHIVVRPATIISESDPSLSSSTHALNKFRFIARIFFLISQELRIPLIEIDKFSELILKIIDESLDGEFNVADKVISLEEFAGLPNNKLRLSINWRFLSFLGMTNGPIDRFLTLMSVSDWIKENHSQLGAKILE